MPIQPGFSNIAAALADPAREAMLVALADGKALPAGELAAIAGVSAQGASAHLQKLLDSGVLSVLSQGRYRYYRISDEEVARVIEALANLAGRSRSPVLTRRRIPPELCFARHCYSHLAGRLGVFLARALRDRDYVRILNDKMGELTPMGERWCLKNDIACKQNDRDVRLCLDWSERVHHFAGPMPNAVFHYLVEKKHLVPLNGERALRLTENGRLWFGELGVRIDHDDQSIAPSGQRVRVIVK